MKNDILNSSLYKNIIESIGDGVFIVNTEWKICLLNKAAEKILGITQKQSIGKPCRSVFRSSICDIGCLLKESIKTGKPIINKVIYIIKSNGNTVPISITASPLKNEKDEIIGGVETFRDLTEINILRNEIKNKYKTGNLISKNHELQKIFSILPDIAKSNSSVLITGESGTGKEVTTRTIHNMSNRKDKPFVAINCGALPESLAESELFGYKKGAFTGADNDKPGKFQLAQGGTILLDEIGELPLNLQVKILRVLQEKMYEPLGSNEIKKINCRIIAATNKDLKEEVKKGTFREDLFYRLNVIKLYLPPLRERKEDIPILLEYFIKKYNSITGKNIEYLSTQALKMIMRYDYPGNIRELENIIEFSFILCKEKFIQVQHLPDDFVNEISKNYNFPTSNLNIPITLDEGIKSLVKKSLIRNNNKKMATCRELKISKDRLRRLIKKYNI